MFTPTQIAQLAVAACVLYVWTFCLKTLIKEFKQFRLSEQVRSIIGVIKVVLATMLFMNVWYPNTPVLWPAMIMGLLMVAAQYYHYTGRTPIVKRVPSMVLLLLCIYISLSVSGKI